MTSKTVFLAPVFFSYLASKGSDPGPVLYGSIKLGSLITRIGSPGHSIGWGLPLDMTDYNMSIRTLDEASIDHTDDSSLSFSQKLFVEAVELVGAKRNIDIKNPHKVVSAMDEIKMEMIDPSDAYVKASIRRPNVQSWLKAYAPWPHPPILMVCGIFIAQPGGGSKADISVSSPSHLSAGVQVDGAAIQSPEVGSAEADAGYEKETGVDFLPKEPFIYGFTLRECFLKRGVGSSKPHTEGAEMHGGSAAVEQEV